MVRKVKGSMIFQTPETTNRTVTSNAARWPRSIFHAGRSRDWAAPMGCAILSSMSFILVCLDVCHRALVTTGSASPDRKAMVVALSGFYLAGVGWWAGRRILAAWRTRDPRQDHWM